MYPVYLIRNCHPNSGLKCYVGVVISKGKTIEQRFDDHLRGRGSKYLKRAISKYGKGWFSIKQIDAGGTPEEALELEKVWIKTLGTFGNGYNLTEGGDGIPGYRHSDEVKKRMSENHIQTEYASQMQSQNISSLWSDPEFRAKRHAGMFGHSVSDEGRKNMSKAQQGHEVSVEQRANISATLTGTHLTEERKAKIGSAVSSYKKQHPESYEMLDPAKGGRFGSHSRWHVKRGIVNPYCGLCMKKGG